MPEVEKSSESVTSRRAALKLHAKTKQKPAVPVKLSPEEEVRYAETLARSPESKLNITCLPCSNIKRMSARAGGAA